MLLLSLARTRAHAILFLIASAMFAVLLAPALAGAATSAAPPLPSHELLTSTQFYAAVIGALVPGVTYVLNHYAPWCSDAVKAIVLAVVAAGAGAAAQLLDAGALALDTNTLQVVGTAVALAFLAHAGFWKPSGLAALLKAGTNRQGVVATPKPISVPIVLQVDSQAIAKAVADQTPPAAAV